jgi:hypothetical protein
VSCAGKTFLLLGTLALAWVFPGWAQTTSNARPQVVVSVYNDARVTAEVLAEAEREAAKIFNLAEVEVIWENCPSASTNQVDPDALVRAGEQSSPGSVFGKYGGLRPAGVGAHAPTLSVPDCVRFEWPSRLALRVVPYSGDSKNEVFGEAFLSAEGTGCYSDVFYDRAVGLNADWHVSLTDILGNVMAHELGHLLLGSNSHTATGIMRARWQAEELRRPGSFNAEQAERMRGRLRGASPGLTVAARASY